MMYHTAGTSQGKKSYYFVFFCDLYPIDILYGSCIDEDGT